jgi:ABC-2 type transport system permease protein
VPWWLRVVIAGGRVQASRTRGAFFVLAAIATPVTYAVVFLLMARQAGNAQALAAYVVVAPALMGVFYTAIANGGDVVADERGIGTLELLIAAPAPTALTLLGRVTANTLISLVSVPLVVFVARVLGVNIVIADPAAAFLAFIALALSTISVTVIFASTFVLARSAAVIQNLIPFPIYILSGIAFPLTLLPTWVWPLSALVPLKYVGELLRSSTQSQVDAPAISSVAPLLVLTFAYTVLGFWLFARIERSVRLSGRISLGE